MLKPINNIFWIPVEKISFLACIDGKSAQGGENSYFLSEGETAGEARISLRRSIGFADNYNDLPPEKRKGLTPFRFRKGEMEKVLSCSLRFKSKNQDYICGKPTKDKVNGEYGMCCIEGFDVPEGLDCPYESKKRIMPF